MLQNQIQYCIMIVINGSQMVTEPLILSQLHLHIRVHVVTHIKEM